MTSVIKHCAAELTSGSVLATPPADRSPLCVVALADRDGADDVGRPLHVRLAHVLGDDVAAHGESDQQQARPRVPLHVALQHHVKLLGTTCDATEGVQRTAGDARDP